MRNSSVLPGLSVLALAGLLLTGCAKASQDVATAPTNTPSPTATVEPVSVPKPLIDVDCEDIGTAAQISQVVNDDVHSVDPESGDGMSLTVQLQQLGGFSCRWENDTPETNLALGPQNYNMTLNVLPKAGGKWDRYADAYDIDGDSYSYCYDYNTDTQTNPSFFCGYFAHVNDVWIELYVEGADRAGVVGDKAVVASVAPFLASVKNTFAGSAYVAEPWVAPATTAALPSECVAFASNAQLQEATGVAKPLNTFTYTDGPQVGMTLSLDNKYLVKSCTFAMPKAEIGIGGLAALPGGAWAWENPDLFPADAQSVEVAGLKTGERAVTGCVYEQCTIDLLVGGNWIRVYVYHEEGLPAGYEFGVTDSEALGAIATVIVANLG